MSPSSTIVELVGRLDSVHMAQSKNTDFAPGSAALS